MCEPAKDYGIYSHVDFQTESLCLSHSVLPLPNVQPGMFWINP